MDAPTFKEGTLGRRYDVSYSRCKSNGQDLCNELGERVHQTDWSELPNFGGLRKLGQKHYICRVQDT